MAKLLAGCANASPVSSLVCYYSLLVAIYAQLSTTSCQRVPFDQAPSRRHPMGSRENGAPKVKTKTTDLQAAAGLAAASSRSPTIGTMQYKCAKHCSCSLVEFAEPTATFASASRPTRPLSRRPEPLTKAHCGLTGQFSDLLTIDRRTQIIHISLPTTKFTEANPEAVGPVGGQPAAAVAATADPFAIRNPDEELQLADGERAAAAHHQFRMPRLAQFGQLREVVISGLRIEICDSEIFKRGQRLLKLQWNLNQLRLLTKACLRHLDQLAELNLDQNRLAELESALFSNLANLKSLSLAHNQLEELAAHQFANLTNLVRLNLAGNAFKSINLHLFEPMQRSLRSLNLADNQLRAFVYALSQLAPVNETRVLGAPGPTFSPNANQSPFAGAIFKSLVKLNVDRNRIERVKVLQLHRFYNVKFLSIQQNRLATIRDRAFNGLRLLELNLARNELRSVSRCAFCNSTIKRLDLADNNISLPLLADQLAPPVASGLVASGAPGTPAEQPPPPQPPPPDMTAEPTGPRSAPRPSSTASMLILSQSIFGPLFGHLEYLDLSGNEQLGAAGDQLEALLEPLLELRYLNLARAGLERSLPSPTLFKNQRRLRYLNLSHNQLDQLIAETIEATQELELLDLSGNKFSELDESLLVSLDELPALKLINLASNPWYCSQCKIVPLYDWMLRSPIYNFTCLGSSSLAALASASTDALPPPATPPEEDEQDLGAAEGNPPEGAEPGTSNGGGGRVDAEARGAAQPSFRLQGQGAAAFTYHNEGPAPVDQSIGFDSSILGDARQPAGGVPDVTDLEAALATLADELAASDDELGQRPAGKQAAGRLVELAQLVESGEFDQPIGRTLISLQVASLAQRQLGAAADAELAVQLLFERYFGRDFCLKCEFPSELRANNIHELSPNDFKYCAGSAPRFAASEPRIGLTLAIVIIGALFCIIVVVIVMYRRKSNTYFPNEEPPDQPAAGAGGGGGGGKRPILSVSSDVDQQYGDATDYSSPPMSQSYDSYSPNDEDIEDEDQDEEEAEEEELEEEDEELEEEDDDEDEAAEGVAEADVAPTPTPTPGASKRTKSDSPESAAGATDGHQRQRRDVEPAEVKRPSPAREDREEHAAHKAAGQSIDVSQMATAAASPSALEVAGSHAARPSATQANLSAPTSKPLVSSMKQRRQATLPRTRPSVESPAQAELPAAPEGKERARPADEQAAPASLSAGDLLAGQLTAGATTMSSIEQLDDLQLVDDEDGPAADEQRPSSRVQRDRQQQQQQPQARQHHAPRLVQLASVAGSLHESQGRARLRQQATLERQKQQQAAVARLAVREPEAPFESSQRQQQQQHPGHPNAPSVRLKQHAHRQSSEHSTAGSVSFAHQRHQARPRAHLASATAGAQQVQLRAAQQPSAGAGLHSLPGRRSDRLIRSAQTIGGDQPASDEADADVEENEPTGLAASGQQEFARRGPGSPRIGTRATQSVRLKGAAEQRPAATLASWTSAGARERVSLGKCRQQAEPEVVGGAAGESPPAPVAAPRLAARPQLPDESLDESLDRLANENGSTWSGYDDDYLHSAVGGNLELAEDEDDDEEDEEDVDVGHNYGSRGAPDRSMVRDSHSSHSALTQLGSGEFSARNAG